MMLSNQAETAPIIEAAEAIAATIANPSVPILAEDLLLAHKLVAEVKKKLYGRHPSIGLIFQTLFNLP